MSNKITALARHLDLERGERQDIEQGYDDNIFEYGDEYLVVTDAQADAAAAEEIEQTLWAFNADFLEGYVPLPAIAIKAVQNAMYEDAAPVFRALFTDEEFAEFVQDAISADGRGHYLSTYDGAEHEETVGRTTYYIYKR